MDRPVLHEGADRWDPACAPNGGCHYLAPYDGEQSAFPLLPAPGACLHW